MDTENKALVGHVHSLETFGLVDGPGVRTVVFLQGCRMRCRYCHNPETWSMSGGEEWSCEGSIQPCVPLPHVLEEQRRYYRQRRRAASAD